MRFGLTKKQEIAILRSKKAGTALRILKFVRSRRLRGATCDECLIKLRLRSNSASTRMHELALAGLLKSSGVRRRTRAGRLANVFVCASGGSFVQYLTLPRIRFPKGNLSPEDVVILGAGKEFVQAWSKSQGPDGKKKAVIRLVDTLRSVVSRHVKSEIQPS